MQQAQSHILVLPHRSGPGAQENSSNFLSPMSDRCVETIGMKLRVTEANRQKAAQTGQGRIKALAGRSGSGSVSADRSTSMPALRANLLFRTPSSSGRYVASSNRPSVFFSGLTSAETSAGIPAQTLCVQQGSAQFETPGPGPLNPQGNSLHLSVQKRKNPEGWAGCRSTNSFPDWRCARGLQPVATRRANRPFMAAVQACSARLLSMQTPLSAQQPVLRATFFIARSKTAVTDLQPHLRGHCGLSFIQQNTVSGPLARSGVLRSEHPKTKDIACSTRS